MKKSFLPFINPLSWIKAWRYNRKNTRYKRSAHDPELYLYSQILRNDMLHYGYFSNPDVEADTLSLKDLEDAQVHYARNIIEHITNKNGTILDVGCGMGGLSGLLLNEGYQTEALTPDMNQVTYIRKNYPGLTCHHSKFETFNPDKQYDTIINSESVQYIKINDAFEQVDKLLKVQGRWIVVDYFRIRSDAKHKSGHVLEDFKKMIQKRNWKIKTEQDITPHVLPTLRFINMYAQRFLLPVKHYAFEKLRYKKGWLYFLTKDLQLSIENKLTKELAAIDPELFATEKKYVLMVVERDDLENIEK